MRQRMRQASRLIGVASIVVAILAMGVPTAWAGHQQPLSAHHTAYGVSQLLAGTTINSITAPLKLFNPVHFTQIAAALIYESKEPAPGGNAEVFQSCVVARLTPHHSEGFALTTNRRVYIEVISSPEAKQKLPNGQMVRLGDGMGINGSTGDGSDPEYLRLLHPAMFSLPSNAVVAGQREAAITCICDGLAAIGAPIDVFHDHFLPPCP